jgi:predicted nucleotidyltransferase
MEGTERALSAAEEGCRLQALALGGRSDGTVAWYYSIVLSPSKQAALRTALEQEPAMRLAYLFGSVARGDDGPESDVDVAVWLADEVGLVELGVLSERLGAAIGGKVDVVDLRLAPPLLCWQVVTDGEPLCVRDAVVRFDFEMSSVRRYEDTRRLRSVQQELLKELLSRGRAA